MRESKLTYALCTGVAVATLTGCAEQNPYSTHPNILIVMLDDLGFSDLEPFGGEIHTPTINALAEQGKIFTRFHTSPLSAPARSMLMTGVDNHRNGLGNMPPAHFTNQYMQAGYEGYLRDDVMTIPEILSSAGYYSCISGKWHLGAGEYDPHNRGFDDSFVLLSGGASHFSSGFSLSDGESPLTYYTENGERIERLPEDFYSSKSYADKMIEYIDKCPEERPLFGYLAFTCGHDPLHVPAEWADRYKGRYDEGYDVIRKTRYDRQKAMGIISPETKLNHSSETAHDWSSLSGEQRAEQSRRMEIYAAMIDYVDMSLGRVVDKLKSSGRYDNTIIFVMVDNGANPHEAWGYPGNSEEQIARDYDNSLENMGAETSFISLGQSWAEVCNTPYSLFKMTTMEGGICTPLVVAGGGTESGRMDTCNVLHISDVLPTILELTGCTRPAQYRGVELVPLYGKSLYSILMGDVEVLRDDSEPLCFEMGECKAVIKGDWKAVLLDYPFGDGETWRLYNLKSDLIEKEDLAQCNPDKLKEMVACWMSYADSCGYIKGNGEPVVEVLEDAKLFYNYDLLLIR
ncbi:MAG: arylsulfatase [Rikenellaceae bacterium]